MLSDRDIATRSTAHGVDLGQRAPSGQGAADERMPAVVDGQCAKAFPAECLAGGAEPATVSMALEGLSSTEGLTVAAWGAYGTDSRAARYNDTIVGSWHSL